MTEAQSARGRTGGSRLASALRDLGSRQATVDETLQAAVDLSIELIDGCDVADIMFLQQRHITTPVSTNPRAHALAKAQQETNQGPCLLAALEQELVIANDLRQDSRWPVFALRAQEQGIVSVVSYQLFLHRNQGDRFGALNLYGSAPNAFDDRAVELGEVFAAHCATALAAAIAEEGARSALQSRDVIGQAKGILMARHQLTAQQAFALLHKASQDRNVKLRELAEHVAETGTLPD